MPATRRDFLYGLGAMGAFALVPIDRTDPDVILYNANILTIDAGQPHAQAVAIADGRFLAVGDDEDVRDLSSGTARRSTSAARPCARIHRRPRPPCRAGLAPPLGRLRSAIDRRDSERHPRAGRENASRRMGARFKYDDTKTTEGRPLTQDLDAAAPDHPVLSSASRRPHGVRQFSWRSNGPRSPRRRPIRRVASSIATAAGRLTGRAAKMAASLEKLIPSSSRATTTARARS